MAKAAGNPPLTLRERLEDALIGGALGLLRLLPYRWRVPFAGWLVQSIAAPLIGMRKRVRANLDLAMPELPEAEKTRLARQVPDNLGRFMAEIFSPAEFTEICRATPFEGPGLAAFEQARARGQGVIAVSGHFANYDVFRVGMSLRGYSVGGLYRPMNNRAFHQRYLNAIETLATPLYERSRRGMAQMVKHLRNGNVLAMLTDQHMRKGEELHFFGLPAYTAVSAAQLALKYDALLIPIYVIRQPDGLSFRVELEAPIPHSDEITMTQALNDSLEARVRTHMEQWLWTHRRWKKPPKGAGHA
ncbi:lysophospholipid acyltransferase family protein [Thioclava sp. A2]|uniref:lysophospholipid acyltransferase family protein n=1 Tax=Thioclava sp. FCG-A2 TaxID=3080562 RepID=UPI002954711D|nr:lysophospholipid acyltransferase family protein [Thioclava sp. A2]MDV7270355.1 lysophospholipid acyltransferase family protein [Thioclava sp. A2]